MSASKLMDKVKKNSTVDDTSSMSQSRFFANTEPTQTRIPIINLALSGKFNGGFGSGMTTIAGESKSFKTMLGLMMVKAYMEKYPDAICLFYDTEFGTPPNYLNSQGIDLDRVLHTPVMHIEQMKFDMVRQLNGLTKEDKVIVFIDSVGNVASKKEVEDAEDMKSVADMTRAKALKSLFRITTPKFKSLDMPCVAIQHTYKSQSGLYPVDVVSGGSGGVYAADAIFIITKSKEKDGKEVTGFTFKINIEKSRFVIEKSKFPFTVMFDGGINKWTGLFDMAREHGYIRSPKNGWYCRVMSDSDGVEIEDSKNWRRAETDCAEFWKPIFEQTDFAAAMEKKFSQGSGKLLQEDEESESSTTESDTDED